MDKSPSISAILIGMVAFAPMVSHASTKSSISRGQTGNQCGLDRNNPSRSDLKANFLRNGILMVDAHAAPQLPQESCYWRKKRFGLEGQRFFKLRYRNAMNMPFAVREEIYASAEAAANRLSHCVTMPPKVSESSRMLIEMRECFRIGQKVYFVSTDDTLALSQLPEFAAQIKNILQHMPSQSIEKAYCGFDARPIPPRTNNAKQDILVHFFKKSGYIIANNRAPPALLPEDCRWLRDKHGLRARRHFKVRSQKPMTLVDSNLVLRKSHIRFVVSEEVYATSNQAMRRAADCNHGRALRGLYGEAALSRVCFTMGNRVYTLANEKQMALTAKRMELAMALRSELSRK